MIRMVGSRRQSRRVTVPVSEETLRHALEVTDYHEVYLFERGIVKVVEIEGIDETEDEGNLEGEGE